MGGKINKSAIIYQRYMSTQMPLWLGASTCQAQYMQVLCKNAITLQENKGG